MATTIAIDVGGTSIKVAKLIRDGSGIDQRSSRRTPPGLSPVRLVEILLELIGPMEPFDQVGVGFPGPVMTGRVVEGANLTRPEGPGGDVNEALAQMWRGFDLRGSLHRALNVPVEVCNDADVAALACATGIGRELTVTLGTGVGTGLVVDGKLAPHVEHSETALLGVGSLDELVGERARKILPHEVWQTRVVAVLEHLETEVQFDACYLAGGNARRVWRDGLGALRGKLWVRAEPVGLLGCARLFNG